MGACPGFASCLRPSFPRSRCNAPSEWWSFARRRRPRSFCLAITRRRFHIRISVAPEIRVGHIIRHKKQQVRLLRRAGESDKSTGCCIFLFGGRSSRLHRLFCLDEEIALSVRGSISPFVDPGLFEMWIFVREGERREAALELLDKELARLGAGDLSAYELEKTVNQLELSFLHGLETAGGKAEQIGFYETVANNGAAVFDRLGAYRDVTADDVTRVVRKYLRPSRRTRVEIVPSAA